MNWPSKIINDINSILLPPVCFGCNVQLSGGEYTLCTVCRHDLPLTDYNFSIENPVDRIFYGRVPIQKAASFLVFQETGIVKNLLHYLKYRNQEHIGDLIGDWFGGLMAKSGDLEVDAVIPVPLHRIKLKKRGYNQVEKFGLKMAKHLKAPYVDDVLIKTENTITQTKKGRGARLERDSRLFALQNWRSLEGKRLLLVDDVITTGATIEACAHALLEIPQVQLFVATMASVPLNRS